MDHARMTTRASSPAARRPAFTLIEMLIVTAVITMIVLISVPAFRAMQGGRSLEAATNNVSAVIGVARQQAIGLQKPCGVLFYIDQATDRVVGMVVHETPMPTTSGAPAGFVYLDVAPSTDFLMLPMGVGLNTMDSAGGTNTARTDDAYIGYNPCYVGSGPMAGTVSIPPRIGGLILFDGYGRLVTRPYRFRLHDGTRASPIARVFAYNPDYNSGSVTSIGRTASTAGHETVSSVGLVLFDLQNYRDATTDTGAAFTEGDAQAASAGTYTSGPELKEEKWIDDNGMPFLVNRYNGTLIKAE